MSAIDTAEFRKLTLLAAGIDPTEIPPILDTAEWRRLLIVAIEQATAGGGGGAVSIDAGANSLVYFNNATKKLTPLTVGPGITFSGNTITATSPGRVIAYSLIF